MRQLLNFEKRGKEWTIFLRSGRAVYASTCYAKAVGVHEYLEQRRTEAERETRATQIKFRELNKR